MYPTLNFDQKRVLNRLDALSRKAEELGQISEAARCEELIGKHRGMFVDCTALLSDLDPAKLTPEVLDKLADHLIAKALKEKGLHTPAMVAEVTKRLEAGETVTEEDLEKLEKERPNAGDESRCSSVSIVTAIK
ncbi:MAG TPA: hypothetical protein VGP62_12550 [Bryobacteraceae bacterium]|nr:hypothetical protein [Bryobacteraceae bacterium]